MAELSVKVMALRGALRLVISILRQAQSHLEFCGYGDCYERECAKDSKLDEKIAEAIKRGEECLSKN